MKCPVVIQTCDRYSRFWDGMFRFMDKHWDRSIDSEIFFCNEEAKVDLPEGFRHLPTGKGTFAENLRFILNGLGSQHVFYMLEDFWPIAPMRKDMFDAMHKFFTEVDADALQISPYLPYYSLRCTDKEGMFEFSRDSDWIFNFQARFWKSDVFLGLLSDPEISESIVNSAITVEMASDRRARDRGGIKAFLFHYFWYPISGVSYRGELTDTGREMQNIVNIDRMVEDKFSEQA